MKETIIQAYCDVCKKPCTSVEKIELDFGHTCDKITLRIDTDQYDFDVCQSCLNAALKKLVITE